VSRRPVRDGLFAFLALALLALASAPARAEGPPLAPEDRVIALVGGMLIEGYVAPPVHHAAILIRGDEILAVGPAGEVEIPEEAHLIDTRGKTMLPGLIDAHVHVDLVGHGDYARFYEFIGGMQRLGEVMPIAAKQMLRAGVTTAVDLGTPFEIFGLRERIGAGEIPGPRLIVSGPWITRLYLESVPGAYQILIDSPAAAAAAANRLIDRGVDVIKTWEGLTPADYEAVVEAAHARGVKVHAHLYQPEKIRAAIDAGVDVLQHVGSAKNAPYDGALVREIAQKKIPVVQTIAHRIWVYPATLAFPERLRDPVLAEDMPADIYRELQASFENFHRLAYFRDIGLEMRRAKQSAGQFIAADAYMGVGSDAASPLNFHTEAMWREMSALVDSGMNERQAIVAATKTNAEIIDRFDRLGSLEPGKLADILVVEGNPLAVIERLGDVAFVVKGGVPYYAPPAASETLAAIGRPF